MNIESLNTSLRELYGIETESTNPMWRIVWAPDQFEMRTATVTPSGVELLFPELMKFKKYPWVGDRWILENLVLISDENGFRKSYECMWKFEDRFKNPVEPELWACQFIVDLVYAAKTGNPMNARKYFDPEVSSDPEEQIAINKERIDLLVEQLFGDESDLMLRTTTGEAIAMPQNYKRET